MVRRLLLIALVWVCAGTGFGQTAIPDTPAGHTLAAWLDAFNSGDRAKVDAYVKTYDPKHPDNFVTSAQFRSQTGGFDLVAVERSEALAIVFRVKEKAGKTVAIGRIELASAQPPSIEHFGLRALPPGAVPEDIKLDEATRKKVIEDVITDLNEYYVYPETAQKMADGLRTHEKNGDYKAISDGDDFAALLTTHLLDVSHDKHLHVTYNPFKLTAEPPEPTPAQRAENRKDMERDCGFRKVEILPNNIGYLKFDFFADPMACGPTAAAAMAFLAHVDAIIYDLRENGGGDPKMVALMCSYLFDEPTHLNDLYDRKDDKTTQYWTLPYVPGDRLADKPAFVLTSGRTFSGAEEFTYDLKNLKRATIVGETTGGGAHPVSGHRAGDHFMVGVPGGRPINPVSKTDWEGAGVAPDVAVNASDGLETAERLAVEKIQGTEKHAAGNAPGK